MKKKLMLLITTLSLMVVMTGCFDLEAGIKIKADGTGEIYNKLLIAEDFKEGVTSEEMFDFTNPVVQPIEEMINGEKYIGEITSQKFTSLEELSKITASGVKIKTEGNVSTLSITMENEETAEELDSDELLEMMASSISAKFKITVPGKIIETSGAVEGNTVTWDLLDKNNSEKLVVKYENTGTTPIKPSPVKPAPTTKAVKVTINGRQVDFVDQDPVIVNSRTLVPIRMVSEELGMEVEWDNSTRTAKIFNDEKSIFITIGEKDVITYHELNKNIIMLDVPAQIINGRTMVPLRAISEILNIQVDWNQETCEVVLVR